MSDKLNNPFMTPKAPEVSSPQPATPPQQANLMPSAPSAMATEQTVPTAIPGTNPFAGPHAMPSMPTAPVTPSQQAAAPVGQMPQQPVQPAQPSMPAQSVVRDSAASYQPVKKAPNPFDFANQGSGNGGTSASPEQAASGGRIRYQALQFTGGIGEYYGVVILNALLVFITLGIYAPWAKVRKKRYFYSHTEFLDEGFQFTATGKNLFIGRIVGILALVGLSLIGVIPILGIIITVLTLFIGVPFILNRSLRFQARHTAWRDVRFGWDGTLLMAFLVWMVYPLLSLITLGLAQPLAARALRRHYAENHSFGAAKFSADLGLGAFYMALLKSFMFLSVLVALFGGIGFALAAPFLGDMFGTVTSYDDLVFILALLPPEKQAILAMPFIGIALAFYMAGGYYFGLVRHIMVDHLRLEGGIRLRSSLSAFKYAMVIISNLIINVITLGFAHPYTVVRHYRYLTQAIEIRPIANMAGFIDNQTKAGFSVFEEVADIEGLSIEL